MVQTKRPKVEKNIIAMVPAIAVILIAAGSILGVLSAQEMRETVTGQFNQEQLVIARNIKHLIEKEVDSLKREISLLSQELMTAHNDTEDQDSIIRQCHSRIVESGVWKIEVVDTKTLLSFIHIPFKNHPIEQAADPETYDQQRIGQMADQEVWISRPRIKPNGITLTLGKAMDSQSRRLLLFHVNITWFLSPMLRDIRSGKTGYAWIIDDQGHFLYHPDVQFLGRDAFRIREKKYPEISFMKINFIQQQKMLKGSEGTGLYTSGWHRGITGKIAKLIAYSPIDVSEAPAQKWSVAVVAPTSEIEAAVRKGYLQQFMLQALMITAVVLGALSVILLEKRWSRQMEGMVVRRTEAYKRSEEKYRSLVESAEDFIFTVDPDGHLQSMNSYTAKFFGGRPEDFIGRHLSGLFDEAVAKKQVQLIRLVSSFGRSLRDEFQLKLGEHPIWIDANFMPLKNIEGRVKDILCIARDITENKNLEKQLVNTEKLASLGTLAAGVAHEVNNPLGVMLGFCDLLIQKTDPDSQNYQDLKTIERQGFHCKQVVENLLSFSRLKGGATEYSEINDCLSEIIHVVRHTLEMNDIELHIDQAENMPPVRGDTRRLQQVFLNLINNALAAMEGGGRLMIETRLERDTGKAVIAFSDNGTGILPEDVDHIFEPFFTTKPEGQGTGLGLFVSYGIVAKYGGTIECISPTGRGTTFNVRLPTKS